MMIFFWAAIATAMLVRSQMTIYGPFILGFVVTVLSFQVLYQP